MKNTIFTILVLVTTFSASANVLTVSNDPLKPAQYTSTATAMAAANPGDTLYIYGSPTSYGDLDINKNISIIGAGNNTRKEVFYKTVFQKITFTAATLANVVLDGLYVIGNVSYQEVFSVLNFSGFTIRNCIILNTLNLISGAQCGSVFNNLLVENCFIINFSNAKPNGVSCFPVSSNLLVKNTVIRDIQGLGGVHNHHFVNCQFGIEGGGAPGSFYYVVNSVFDNCIFYKMNFGQSFGGNENNLFHNCLTYLTVSPSQSFDLNSWTGGSSGTATNCIINQNPLWVNSAIDYADFWQQGVISRRSGKDPAINTGSPAANAGTDGTDIGLTGGTTPYNWLAEPKIPVVRKYQLVNAVVPPNGTVTIKATATKAQ
jgi:hypothetical protein